MSKKTKKPTKARVTVASFMRDLISKGKTNEEVFAAAKRRFGIGDEKKHYPGWYRSQLKRAKRSRKAA